MEKVITSIDAKEGKFGMYKTLFFDDGGKISVTQNNKSYGVFTGPGKYDITFKNYNGKEVVSAASKLSKGDLDSAQQIIGKKQVTAAQSMEERISFEREKQKDIMVECYMGIAKDICIANKGSEKITTEMVEETAFNLIAGHYRVKNGKDIPAIVGDIQASFPGAVLEKKEEELPDIPY
jgi:hypothetical protein